MNRAALLQLSSRRGLTLIEVVLTVGLIGLLIAAISFAVEPLLSGLGDEAVADTLRKAVREVRYEAGVTKEDRLLRFDPETASFVIETVEGSEVSRLETPYSGDTRLRVTFFALSAGENLPGRGLDASPVEVDYVRFGADRSSTPFEVEIDEMGAITRHRFDPLSYLEIVANEPQP